MQKCEHSVNDICQSFAFRYGNVHPACDGKHKMPCTQGDLDLIDTRDDPFDHPQPRKHAGRGGKRPGAGAPKGNLNAIKSGTYSRQLKATFQQQKNIITKARLARERRSKQNDDPAST